MLCPHVCSGVKEASPGGGQGSSWKEGVHARLRRGQGQLCRSALSGDSRQHQEQAAQPHHLHGDRWCQSAGGLR